MGCSITNAEHHIVHIVTLVLNLNYILCHCVFQVYDETMVHIVIHHSYTIRNITATVYWREEVWHSWQTFCLFNNFINQHRKTLRITLFREVHQWLVKSPHKWSVMQQAFPGNVNFMPSIRQEYYVISCLISFTKHYLVTIFHRQNV